MKTEENKAEEKEKTPGRETPDIPAMVKVLHPEAKKMLREALCGKKTPSKKSVKKPVAKKSPAKKTSAKKTAAKK